MCAISDIYDNCFKYLCEHEYNEICDDYCNVFQLRDSTSKTVLPVEGTAKKNKMV